jgi:nucleotide-binding universal stress UspA family protein
MVTWGVAMRSRAHGEARPYTARGTIAARSNVAPLVVARGSPRQASVRDGMRDAFLAGCRRHLAQRPSTRPRRLRRSVMTRLRHLLAGTDFGSSSRAAIALAIDIARTYGAAVTVVHAYSIVTPAAYTVAFPSLPYVMDAVRAAAEEQMKEMVAELRAQLPAVDALTRVGDPATVILEAAEENADLVVVGTHGYRGFSRLMLGSVAEKVVRLCPVPVLTVRGTDRV